MKILMISPYLPSPTSGNRSRTYHLLKMLARQHTVSLLAIEGDPSIKAPREMVLLENFTHRVEMIPRSTSRSKRVSQLLNALRGKSTTILDQGMNGLQEKLDLLFAQDQYDIVLFERSLTSYSCRLPANIKVILDQHNIEYEVLQRSYLHAKTWLRKWYNWREYCLVKPAEIKLCQAAHAIAVTSERERLQMKGLLPRSIIETVPNGVDIEYFHGNHTDQEVDGRIVFTGSMEYYPNVEGVVLFAKKCWPLIREHIPNATWHIVGKNPLPGVQNLASLPGVTVTGSVADVRPYFAEAQVAIVPLLQGSGTRLKILEAMAMRKAIVSTTIGCEGLSVVPEKHLLVEDQMEAFAQTVIRLLEHPEQRRVMGNAGRELAEAEYSWDTCGDQLLKIVDLLH